LFNSTNLRLLLFGILANVMRERSVNLARLVPRTRRATGHRYDSTHLCAPSMGAVLMGFKSPVRESNMARKHHGKH
jgi:hypothetical protein